MGALFFSGFGALWLGIGLAAIHRLSIPAVIVLVLLLAALATAALKLLHVASQVSPDLVPNETARIRRVFNRVNTVQWVAVGTVILILNFLQRQVLIAPAIAVIVGLHLFPLARLFHYPAHYMTGVVLIVWSVAVAVSFPSIRIPSISSLGTGLILIASAALSLRSAARAAKNLVTDPV
jgi:hypothetical protein